jgi:hypothetical protein
MNVRIVHPMEPQILRKVVKLGIKRARPVTIHTIQDLAIKDLAKVTFFDPRRKKECFS